MNTTYIISCRSIRPLLRRRPLTSSRVLEYGQGSQDMPLLQTCLVILAAPLLVELAPRLHLRLLPVVPVRVEMPVLWLNMGNAVVLAIRTSLHVGVIQL